VFLAHQHRNKVPRAWSGITCRRTMRVGRLGSAARPLAELGGHSHWVWSARFCPAHNALLLSGSSDALVNLWHVPWMGAAGAAPPPPPSVTPSTGPSREADGGRGKPEVAPGTLAAGAARGAAGGAAARGGGPRGGARDSRVRAFDDHESSVYSAPRRFARSCQLALLRLGRRRCWPPVSLHAALHVCGCRRAGGTELSAFACAC
jgi:WD40 repeat protein